MKPETIIADVQVVKFQFAEIPLVREVFILVSAFLGRLQRTVSTYIGHSALPFRSTSLKISFQKIYRHMIKMDLPNDSSKRRIDRVRATITILWFSFTILLAFRNTIEAGTSYSAVKDQKDALTAD